MGNRELFIVDVAGGEGILSVDRRCLYTLSHDLSENVRYPQSLTLTVNES